MDITSVLFARAVSGGKGIAEFDTSGTVFGTQDMVSITIPEGVTELRAESFKRFTKLTKVSLPDSLTTISSSAFSGCTKLASLVIPEGVTLLNGNAFEGCTGLKNIDLPSTVETLGVACFSGCKNLETFTIRAVVPPTCSNNYSLSFNSKAIVYVPAESVDAYKAAAVWGNHASYIRAIPTEEGE